MDASGALVPGATIQLKNQGTGEIRRGVSDEAADFTIPNLPPGLYDLTLEHQGFRTLRLDGLELQVEQMARLDLKLDVGSISETVEVTASIPVLNTENASRGDVIVSQEVLEMPLEGRDFNDLAFLVPGVREQPGIVRLRSLRERSAPEQQRILRGRLQQSGLPVVAKPRRGLRSMPCRNSRCKSAVTRPNTAAWPAA